jgi:hypothetical protein
MTARLGHGSCHGPDCREPALRIGGFCSEACYWKWHRAQWLEGKTPAEYVLEWRHPYRGEIREACCRLHYDKVRGALNALGIGHAGCWADSEACVRCIHEGKETRDWIDSAVVRGQVTT